MKRPFAVLGGVALTVSFLNLYLGFAVAVLFCIAALAFTTYKSERSSSVLLRFVLLLILALNTANAAYEQAMVEKITGQRIIDAQIIKTEEEVGYNRITVSTKVGSLRFKAQLFDFNKGNYTAGDRVVLDATLESTSEEAKAYLNSNRIYISGKVNEIKEINREISVYKGFYYIRNYIENLTMEAVGIKNAAPLIAITTGNQGYFDIATERAIKATGVSHIMVVSGLHLGIICGLLITLLNKFKAKPKTVFFVGLAAITCVLGVCGFHISAIRAAVTYLVMLLGVLIKKRADALNSLGFAVYLITTLNPQIVGNVSFLLSVSATFGVIYLAPVLKGVLTPRSINGRLGILTNGILQAISVSVVALLCTAPVLIFNFGYISVASIFVNVLISYAVSLALILTVIGVATSFIPLISKVILTLAAFLAEYFMWVINLFGSSEWFILYFDLSGKIVFSALAVIIIFLIIYIDARKRREVEYAD